MRSMECWGESGQGQTDIPADLVFDALTVQAGSAHSCAVHATKAALLCWGSNLYLQAAVGAFLDVQGLGLGFAHTCAVNGKHLRCWGNNQRGQLLAPRDW